MERLFEDIYLIPVPLPNNKLREVNTYLIKGEDRSLLVDTGFDLPISEKTLRTALDELGVDPKRLDIFITHQHSDHAGAAYRIAEETARVYTHYSVKSGSMSFADKEGEAEGAGIRLFNKTDRLIKEAAEISDLFENHVVCWPNPKRGYTPVREGDTISIGKYVFHCIETPGHCDSHVCLFDESSGVFLAGDHVLRPITPNIADLKNDSNHLETYLKSLKKIMCLSARHVFPAHGEVFNDLEVRCEELMDHHRRRIENILSLIASGNRTLYDVAMRCDWNVGEAGWTGLPGGVRMFAYAETLAHLNYMIAQRMITRITVDGTDRFEIV